VNETQFHIWASFVAVYTILYIPDYGMKVLYDPSPTDLKYVRFISDGCVTVIAHGCLCIVYIFINQDFTRLGKQMLFHHVIMVTIGFMALAGG
jgi:hypothetical protein